MGMFDWVAVKPEKCPVCGHEIKEFQSKCGFNRCFRVTPKQLVEDAYRIWGEMEVEYYGYCDYHCGAIYYTYDFGSKKWKREFLTRKDLYGDGDEQ